MFGLVQLESSWLVIICLKNDWRSSVKYVRKIYRKTNISNPLIRTSACGYQEVRNVSFPENFAYVPNRWPLIHNCKKLVFKKS